MPLRDARVHAQGHSHCVIDDLDPGAGLQSHCIVDSLDHGAGLQSLSL